MGKNINPYHTVLKTLKKLIVNCTYTEKDITKQFILDLEDKLSKKNYEYFLKHCITMIYCNERLNLQQCECGSFRFAIKQEDKIYDLEYVGYDEEITDFWDFNEYLIADSDYEEKPVKETFICSHCMKEK